MRGRAVLALLIILPAALPSQQGTGPLHVPPTNAKARNDAVVHLLMKMEREWAKAIVAADAGKIRRILSPEITLTTPEGNVQNREDDLAELVRGDFKAEVFDAFDMQVKVYGDCAVVTGRTNVKGTYKGQTVHSQFRWTDTFVKRQGRWRIVASQATPIANPQ
ncbi:MAG TPA: nuclear transport factor 2 family protein [Candidatus Angelobacter sp.]|nr:nuclear transport factor 2 family protein [Candidatus Angelobacter sp.]